MHLVSMEFTHTLATLPSLAWMEGPWVNVELKIMASNTPSSQLVVLEMQGKTISLKINYSNLHTGKKNYFSFV